VLGALLAVVIGASGAVADDDRPNARGQPDLVKQANAPVSSVLQVRFQDAYVPQFWDSHGQGNTFSIAITMPLPEYRLLPFPQLSLLTLPVALTVPGDVTGFGDVRFADLAVFDAGHPISFAGDRNRADTNALFLQPFATYQLDRGWFVRSQPQMVFAWKTGNRQLPVDLGVGRAFKIGRQDVSRFVEPFWNVSHDGPRYGVTFGASILSPDFWR